MGTRGWPLAAIIFATVFPIGWTGVLFLLVLELELISPTLSGRPAPAGRLQSGFFSSRSSLRSIASMSQAAPFLEVSVCDVGSPAPWQVSGILPRTGGIPIFFA
jgi:hypothetical protein